MGFELPSALLALLLVGGPLLAHLVRRRDLRDATLPTVRFLRRAVAESKRRRRITNLLLLLLRVAAVALAALALAAPFRLVPLAAGDGARTALAIVLDDSRSMMATGERSSLLGAAKAAAIEAVTALPEGSTVSVVLAGATPRVLVRTTTDVATAIAALRSLSEASARGGALEEAVTLAASGLRAAPPGARRMLVLSDFARHEGVEDLRWPDEGISVVPIRLAARSHVNRRVTVAEATPAPDAEGALLVRVEVATDGSEPSLPVRLEREGSVVAKGEVTLRDGAGWVALQAPRPEGQAVTAEVVIDGEDALAADDRAAVLLDTSRGTRVLVVNGDPRPRPADDEVSFLIHALAVGEGAGTARARVVDAASASAADLDWADVVLLANVDLGPGRLADQLRRAVPAGLGLIITGGDRVQPAKLAGALGDVLPTGLEVASRPPGGTSGLLGPTKDDGDPGAPLPGLETATFARRHVLETPSAGGSVTMYYGDGRPAAVIGGVGDGRVALLGVPLDDDFGDLPYRPGFLPLVTGLVRDVAGDAAGRRAAPAPGRPADLSRFTRLGPIEVVTPAGRRHALRGEDSVLEDTAEAGVYRVERAGRPLPEAWFIVEAPISESALEVAEPPPTTHGETADEAGGTLRRPLAPLFFLLAALLFALEGFLRQPLGRSPGAALGGWVRRASSR